ncbi:unnamed protein product [Prunus armeniaca]|uniref:Uncharacterized protein n=1 Tax=Prunus armeniaca TaxID=36596 RepID=A0A6J5USV0_PRUAR|nr:unnamed protein product [Prunus armeniaca]
MLSQTLYYITTFQKTLSHIYEANLPRAVHRTCLGHHLRRAVQVTELPAFAISLALPMEATLLHRDHLDSHLPFHKL